MMLTQHTPTVQDNEPTEILGYYGPISNSIISELGDFVRICFADDEKISRKIFAVFIELMQNASFYSHSSLTLRDEKSCGVGKLSIWHDTTSYYIECGNLVNAKTASLLDESVQHINSLDHQALRRYKREKRDSPKQEGSRGAGIGLIQVALLSNNPLQVTFTPRGETHFDYHTTVKIDKPLN